jgi:hypothetical protein
MRPRLDSDLQVEEWRISDDSRPKYQPSDVPEGAPSWWHGDEEASQSWLRSSGVS